MLNCSSSRSQIMCVSPLCSCRLCVYRVLSYNCQDASLRLGSERKHKNRPLDFARTLRFVTHFCTERRLWIFKRQQHWNTSDDTQPYPRLRPLPAEGDCMEGWTDYNRGSIGLNAFVVLYFLIAVLKPKTPSSISISFLLKPWFLLLVHM